MSNSFPLFAVAFARLLFPAEAKLAMEMADHPTTASRGSSGNLREVDLNETPSGRTKRLQKNLQALIRTGMIVIPLTCIPNSTINFACLHMCYDVF